MKHEEVKLGDRVVYARGSKGPLIGKHGRIEGLVHDGLCMVTFDKPFGNNHCMPENLDPVYEATFPPHHAVTVEHNPQFVGYSTVATYLKDHNDCPPDFMDDADRARCVESNDMWVMTWYPLTPVGSYQIAASSFEKLCEFSSRYLCAPST